MSDDYLSAPGVLDKYNQAGAIAQHVVTELLQQCVDGRKVADICALGDKLIAEGTANVGKVEKGKKPENGQAFPTCVSVNNCIGHNSPGPGDAQALVDGDLVKIDLAVHVDGFIATVAHTMVVGQSANPTTGRKADVICAAHFALECALRLMKPGNKNTEVTEYIQKVADQFNVAPLEGVLSHELKKHVIDSARVIINKATPDHKVDEFEFSDNEAYSIDIVMSSGSGRSREEALKPTVYRRNVDSNYQLKMKTSRAVFSDIKTRFPAHAFPVRALDPKTGRMGITECATHGLLTPFPTLYERAGEFVAQFKATVLLLPTGTHRLNTFPLPFVKSDHEIISDDIKDVLSRSTESDFAKKALTGASSSSSSSSTTPSSGEAMDTN